MYHTLGGPGRSDRCGEGFNHHWHNGGHSYQERCLPAGVAQRADPPIDLLGELSVSFWACQGLNCRQVRGAGTPCHRFAVKPEERRVLERLQPRQRGKEKAEVRP